MNILESEVATLTLASTKLRIFYGLSYKRYRYTIAPEGQSASMNVVCIGFLPPNTYNLIIITIVVDRNEVI